MLISASTGRRKLSSLEKKKPLPPVFAISGGGKERPKKKKNLQCPRF